MRAYIYEIRNLETDKRYIGQTIQKPQDRFAQHKYHLKKSRHDNPKLQAAHNKFGANALKYEVLEVCGLDERYDKERAYIDKFDSIRNGYNILYGDRLSIEFTEEELSKKPFSREQTRTFSEEEIYMIKSIQSLFGSLQRPLARLLKCTPSILTSIYNNERYKECCARYNLLPLEEKQKNLLKFLEWTGFTTKMISIFPPSAAFIVFLLREAELSSQEISNLFGCGLDKIKKIGQTTFLREIEEYQQLSASQKKEIAILFLTYSNFHRQSITKLEKYLQNV